MNLEGRLNHLELKMRSEIPEMRAPFNTDDCIFKLGLDSVAIRESAHMASKSLAEAISLALGIEPMEFARLLKEKANRARW